MHLACRGPSRGAEVRTREPSRTSAAARGRRTHAPGSLSLCACAACRGSRSRVPNLRGPVWKSSDTAV